MKYVAIKFDTDCFYHQTFDTLVMALNACRIDASRYDGIVYGRAFNRDNDQYHMFIDDCLWYRVAIVNDGMFMALMWNYDTNEIKVQYADERSEIDRALMDHWLSDLNTLGVLVG